MGACVGKNLPRQSDAGEATTPNIQVKSFRKFDPSEIAMLELTYHDLARRCPNGIVSRQVFQVFFHANGLMAELMFSKFDEEHTGIITKEKFMQAFQIMVKGTFQQKASALFEFYSVQKTNGIRYAELLRILFSYPIQELNKMLFDDRFLKQLGNVMISYYFGPEMKIQEKNVLQPHQEKTNTVRALRRGSAYVPAPHQFRRIENRVKQILQEENKNMKKGNLPPLFKKQKQVQQTKLKPIMQRQFKQSSATLIDLKKQRKAAKINSNISSLIKRYATFLFTSLNLDKDRDVLSKQHFCSLLISHPSIFDIYLTGFHTYIWQKRSDGVFEYLLTPSQAEGFGKLISLGSSKNVYIKLKKTTLFIQESRQTNKVQQVICLQGLNLEPLSLSGELGFRIKHRDGLYPQKTLIFSENKQKWIKELQVYKQSSIFDNYVKLERIGKGNFSNVYKGKEKKTDNLVAIKMIEPNYLNEAQCEVLKREIGILKQCRHPNIVKFIGEYRTSQHIYIITEFLSEGDLFQYTRKKTFLQEYQAAVIFKQLVQSILYLNEELGIIHRDLKPENVMIKLTQDKKTVHRIKIIDFGFGVYKDKLNGLTEEQKYVGTPGFIAPEIYLRQDYNQKIDTFSLGIILYFMLYGHLPFQANFFEEIRQQTITCQISLKNMHWSNISQEAKDLVHKILTFSQSRISTKQILQHPWLNNIQQLKEYNGRNKKKLTFAGF